jgi:glycerol-3-phosphate dehydrogenase subunit C
MGKDAKMDKNEPESTARAVVDACSDCDVCRFLMDADCLLFPELYRLYDKEIETSETISSEELRNLVELCNYCALCPCPNIRADIIKAKTEFIDRDGLAFGVRTLEDVERVSKMCGTLPKLTNIISQNKFTGKILKAATGIHAQRRIPVFPQKNFSQWARKNRLNTRPRNAPNRKIAYFAGCTANYLFPEVARSVVKFFQLHGFEVYYPEQKCCGMPSFLEGDRKLTLNFIRFNIEHLLEAVDNGYQIVCSCSTCGFLLRNILPESAYYAEEYQASVGAENDSIKIPDGKASVNPGDRKFKHVKKSMYAKIFKDEGYFSYISPLKRIKLAENTFDLGEYLAYLLKSGELKPAFSSVTSRMVYFPPCHLREQNIGRPYVDLLKMIPGLTLAPIQGDLLCCGMAGIMGFKRGFHEASVHLGNRLMDKIKEIDPERIVTDCLSCRLQFNQLTPYRVMHPIELLSKVSTGDQKLARSLGLVRPDTFFKTRF